MKEDENQTRIQTYGVLDPETQLNTSKWAKHSYQWIEGPKMSVQAENRSERIRPGFGRTLTEAAGPGHPSEIGHLALGG